MMKFESATLARKIFFPLLAATLLLPGAFAQQLKFGTVDMKKIFDSYYKTKQAETEIKSRATDSDKVYKGMVEDYQKANEEYKTLVEGSNDQAVSAEERGKRKENAERKLLEIQEIEKSVKQYQAHARETIGTMEKRLRENIVKEIRDLVNAKAKAGGFTMVFDSAAQTVYQTPFILFQNGQNELTEEVIKDLNANAPPGVLSGAENPAASK